MSKYEGLTQRLARATTSEIILTFAEIEAATGVELPKSARRPQYWANQVEDARGANKAAREAGFRSFLLAGQDKVRFVRD
ncbi:DUF7662 domain-containing protein [Sinorhizobium psoraleae]|uniref:DUF7662 domain-containing protein n=1 Tax=Sinorhizobium psoraleae TaxID=520838 RepID=A0ABT4KIT5_9HYPH|nr:hypothetical protein [Sinorhizobium psoraleae]MCZ4091680.1 hypothetical protein [Sinorhizobium psoraleae]